MPYQRYLKEFENSTTEVTLHRSGAPDVTGTVDKVNSEGCLLCVKREDEYLDQIFVAHEHIRGVQSRGGLNPDLL